MLNILLVEDEPVVRMTVERLFKDKRFSNSVNVSSVSDIDKADNILKKSNNIDLLLLDISLPGDKNGIEYFHYIKEHPEEYKYFQATTIFLTGDNSHNSVLRAFTDGATDYIKKPDGSSTEGYEEIKLRLLARINELQKKEELVYNNLRIDLSTQMAKVNDQKLSLTKTEFKILWYLGNRLTQYHSRENILENVWDSKVSPRTVDTHISKLNTKLLDAKSDFAVENSYGIGYKLDKVKKEGYNAA